MPTLPSDDTALFALMRERLYAAVLSDALDQAGYRDQAMRADIRPVYPDAVVVGRARTVQSVDVYEAHEDAYEKEIAAVDALRLGDVVVASTQRSTRTCLWGELLSTASVARGASGAVIDGYTRDVRQIRQMGFPVFATGMYPVDSAGRSIGHRLRLPGELRRRRRASRRPRLRRRGRRSRDPRARGARRHPPRPGQSGRREYHPRRASPRSDPARGIRQVRGALARSAGLLACVARTTETATPGDVTYPWYPDRRLNP